MKKKIIVIGPTYPQKGGIVETNNELCKLLSKNNHVEKIGFSYLYPKWFFSKPELFEQDNICYEHQLLHALNPFTWEKVSQLILEKKPDMVIVNWWTTYLSPCYFYIQHRLKGKIPIRAIVHNVYPHGVE